MWVSNYAPATNGSHVDSLMEAKWRGCGTAPELVNYYLPVAKPANKNRGTQRKIPTVRRQPVPPTIQQDHAQHMRFKRMI